MILILKKQPTKYYSFMIIGAVCLSPIILFGSYPVGDEIVFSVLGCVNLVSVMKYFKSKNFGELNRFTRIKIYILSYFLVNILISLFLDFNFSKIRFLNISLALLLILLSLSIENMPVVIKPRIVQIAFQINLLIWLSYYLFYRFSGVNWNDQQAITYVGSAYAALVPAVGLILLLIIESKSIKKRLSFRYLAYFAGCTLASQIYYSRVLQFCCLVSGVLAILTKRNWRSVLGILVAFFLGFILSFPIAGTNINRTVLDIFKETSSSANFVVEPRSSDADRSHQIKCATALILQNDDISRKLFGFGQNNHKFELRPCIEDEFGPVPENKLIRPVGYVALIIDFGLTGLVLVSILFYLAGFRVRHERELLLYVVLLFQIALWTLVTNNLDHQIIYLILILDLLFYFSQGLSKQSKLM
jgi:hypothetical protein